MAKTITSRPSIFGWTNHYDEHGKKIGESRPAIFGGVNHYDANGKKIGHSYPGVFSDEVHYDNRGHRVGHSMTGITSYKNHYDEHGHKIGYTRDNMVKEQVMKNAATAENQEEYEEKRAPLVQRFERLRAQREKLIHECASRKIQGNRIQRFIETLDERPLVLEEWDEELWLQMVDTVTVHSNRMLVFHFRIGKDIQVKLPRMRRSKKG